MSLRRSVVVDRACALLRARIAPVAALAFLAVPVAHAQTTVSFAAQQTFATGVAPHSVEIADVNADGKLDLIIADQGAGTVSVLLGTSVAGAATFTFAAQQTFPTGIAPADVVVADINGDGKPDLVVANASSYTVSVLLNTTAAGAATASFAAQQTFATRQYPFSLAAADLDGDGKLDLVVANAASTVISVLRNTTATGAATVTFAEQQVFATGVAPAAVAVADFNGDGKPDVLVANYGSNTASLLLNTTAAGAAAITFADQVTFTTGNSPTAIAVADLNGDGRLDIAAVNVGDFTTSVLLNTTAAGATAPTFGAPVNFTGGLSPAAVVLADVNGDGKPDMVVPNQTDKTVSVFVNTTIAGAMTPTFAAHQASTAGNDPVAVAVADINGDGKPELVVLNSADNTASVFRNTTAFAGINLNQHGLTGSWYNQATSGQGLELELYPNFGGAGNGLLFGGWFTFDATAAGGQRWYSLQGAISSTNPVAQLGIYAGLGGNFAAAPAIAGTHVGSATLRFTDCTTGVLTYAFDDGRTGTIALTRLTANTTCSATGDNGNAPSDYLLSGSWFDAATSGQGLVFDVNPAQQVFFAGWYTYAPNGAQIGGAAAERWYVIQAPFVPGATTLNNAPIYTATGGVFNDATPPVTAQVGTANITFTSCAAATLTYTFTAGANSGLTGTLHLTRTGPTPAGCSL